jgi:cytochrome c556
MGLVVELLQALDALTCKQCHDDYRVKKPKGQ